MAPGPTPVPPEALAAGADTIVGLVLAPHYSRLSVQGYRERLVDALTDRAELHFVEIWLTHEPYLDVLADYGLPADELRPIVTADDLWADEMVARIAGRLGFADELGAAVGP